ncbi:MAG TPA: isocitrate dehydrogenase (NAD(+)) [bacterium]
MSEAKTRKTITLIKGDGIGPEVANAVVKIIAAAGTAIDWDVAPAGANAFEKCGTVLPEYTVDSVRKNKVALKGPVGTPIGEGFISISVTLRKRLELYANLRPVKSLPNINARYQNIDLIIVRENTEGLYSGIEHEVVPGVVESLKIITEKASTRIAEFAFQYARNNNRKKVTAVHKANIMKLSDGLFLQCSRKVAEKYPDIQYEEKIVDNACMQLILNPYQFDVMVLENLYGDIISDLCAGLVGGLGTAPGANIGNEYAIFEAVHGSAPDIAGKNLANPIALLRSAILMLDYIGEPQAANRIRNAINKVLENGKILTRDLGGTATTTEITDAIIAEL